jgi:long-chain acyl-CoA synthetase
MQLHAVVPATAVLMRWFDAAGWLELAAAEGVQSGVVVPTMLRLLLQQPLENHDLSALRRLVSGSAPLPAEIREQWARRLPAVEVVEGYGCTETAALISTTPVGCSRPGSVGRASAVAELRISPDGEICARGPMLMTGYWRSPADTERALRDGWFHTGDVGRLDSEGYLYVVDRIKDVIIRDGFNVYPRDVEEVLMAHPDVANCAVIGRLDAEHGEEVVAFVQLVPGAASTEAELREYAKAHLSAVKYPRDIRLVEQVPLTSVGKLDRKALRAQL